MDVYAGEPQVGELPAEDPPDETSCAGDQDLRLGLHLTTTTAEDIL